MHLTDVLNAADGQVAAEGHAFDVSALEELLGQRLVGVDLSERTYPAATIQFVTLAAGSSLPMHSVPAFTICVVLGGAGRIGLPDGSSVVFQAPHVVTFEAGAEHSWFDVSQAVSMVCCIAAGA